VRASKAATVAIATLTVGLIAAFGNNSPLADAPASNATEMQIRRDASLIAVSGQVSSRAHEAILRELLGRPDVTTPVSFELQEVQISPPGWALVTELTLRAALLTRFSQVTINSTGVSIRGITSDQLQWAAAIDRLRSALLPGMQLDTRVIELAPAPEFATLCQKQFDALIDKGSIGFAVGITEIATREQALLDGLIETAADCSGWQISVRVRGDGASPSGDRMHDRGQVIGTNDFKRLRTADESQTTPRLNVFARLQ
jgi:hypothetical protein